jgi:tetratricopeptide (TPR) repeat protein
MTWRAIGEMRNFILPELRLTVIVWALILGIVHPSSAANSAREHSVRVDEWNRFADRLLAVHRRFLVSYPIRTEEEAGGYARLPDFYREVSYFDSRTNRLLSRIRWERDRPGAAHVIEIYFYDERGRVERDYSAAFLPNYRNAPYQTLINLHRYTDGLHAFRQFDASGDRLYEYCRSSWFDELVLIELDEPLVATPDTLLNSEAYIACFGYVPLADDNYLDPAWEQENAPAGQADGRERDRNVDTRIASLSLQLRFSPLKAKLLLQRCRTFFEIQDFDKAIEDCSSAIGRNYKLDQAFFWRGMARGRHGQIDEGIADLSIFIERNPNSSLAYTKRGVRQIWRGDLAAAEKDLKRAIELNPKNAEAHDDLGVVLAQRREYDAAIAHFEITIRLAPDYQKAYHNLALVRYLLGLHDMALAAIDRALSAGRDTRSSVLLKGNILEALGRNEDARAWKSQADSMPQRNWSESLTLR